MSNQAIRIRLQELKAKLCCISDQIGTALVTSQRVPNVSRASGLWTNSTNVFSFSIANVGAGNGSFQGETIKPGEIVNFDASAMNNYFPSGSISADGSGTELLITWISA